MTDTREVIARKEREFIDILKLHGRPAYISQWKGMSLLEIVTRSSAQNTVIRSSPWIRYRENDALVTLQANGKEVSGWWAEALPDVLLHARFYGEDGLTPTEVARICSESPHAHPDLTKWLADAMGRFNVIDVEEILPEHLKCHLSWDIKHRKRKIIISGDWGTEKYPKFWVEELIA